MPASTSDYDIPLPSKIKLKKTNAERAEKIYRREQRRVEKEARRIARANARYGTTSTPPRGEQSYSPPRYGPRAGQQPTVDEDDGERPDFDDREEWAEKMEWFAQEANPRPFAGFDMAGGYPFPRFDFSGLGLGGGFGQRIPPRYRPTEAGPSRRGRDAADEVRLDGRGPIPPISHMTDEEYAAFIRDGMNRRRHQLDMEEMERRRAERRAQQRKEDREAEAAREKEEREAVRKAEKRKRERTRVEAEGKVAERKKWKERCAALFDGEILALELRFSDIPWPVYTATGSQGVNVVPSPDDITLETVRPFLFDIAADEAKDTSTKAIEDAKRKVLRDAIRQFHPDRFFARVLPRVRAADQEKVKAAVEKSSRLINELLSTR